MSELKRAFIAGLDENDFKYEDLDPEEEDSRALSMAYTLEKQPGEARYFILFDKDDGRGVQIQCQLTKFTEDKKAAGLEVCNAFNAAYRWAKFYITDELELFVEMDDTVQTNTVLHQVIGDLGLLNDIIEQQYPLFMKALWA